MLPRSFAVVGLILFFFALRGYVMPHAHTTDAVNIEKMTRGNVSCILGNYFRFTFANLKLNPIGYGIESEVLYGQTYFKVKIGLLR